MRTLSRRTANILAFAYAELQPPLFSLPILMYVMNNASRF